MQPSPEPYSDSANIKLTEMKRTISDKISERLTALTTSQANKVLFVTSAQVIDFVLPQPHEPAQWYKKRAAFPITFFIHLQNRFWKVGWQLTLII
jgi:hypothetical protein